MLVTQAALPHMRERGFGRIINNTTSFRTMLRVIPTARLKSALEVDVGGLGRGTEGATASP